jgi:cell division protein FtsL
VKGLRIILAVAVLANLAVLVVTQHARATRLRYEVSRLQADVRELSNENRHLLLRRAEARKPENVQRRARELGLEIVRRIR